ncbi:MAG: protein-disulfide reductase DsbD domain-containing protein, partial [Bacteroidia bacterium]
MKIPFKSIILSLAVLISTAGFAQIFNPVKWSVEVKRISETEAELIVVAKIESKWHLYSTKATEGDDPGPVPTEFTFEKSKDYELIGRIIEGKPIKEHDPNFDMIVAYFSNTATFKQKIKIFNTKNFTIKGNVNFMVCDDQRCLPPTDEELTFEIQAFTEPTTATNVVTTNTYEEPQEPENIETQDFLIEPVKDNNEEINITPENRTDSTSLWLIFLQGLIGGFAALLMPCIYPMLPLTVSFFTKQSKTKVEGIRKATIYGLSIIILYVLLGMIVTILFGSDALNELSTNPWFNIFFFVLFVVFAISFFGAFELTLPSSWVNKADSASNKGGLVGIFFMAATL